MAPTRAHDLTRLVKTQLVCSVSTQMGKPYSIAREDFIIRSAPTWWRGPGAISSDPGLSAMAELMRIVVSFERERDRRRFPSFRADPRCVHRVA